MVFTGKILRSGTVILDSTEVICGVTYSLGSIVPCWRGKFRTPVHSPLSFALGDACTIVRGDGKALEIVVEEYDDNYIVRFQGDGDFRSP